MTAVNMDAGNIEIRICVTDFQRLPVQFLHIFKRCRPARDHGTAGSADSRPAHFPDEAVRRGRIAECGNIVFRFDERMNVCVDDRKIHFLSLIF